MPAPRGPLPTGNARRRNAPTIPTTALPVTGRTGRAPKLPRWIELGEAGSAWWRWAWKTPQAAGWSAGHEATVARRAQLEDDLAALAAVEGLDAGDIEWGEPIGDQTRALIRAIAALASGRLQVITKMTELDDRLGLNPKAMAALRWTVVDTPTVEARPAVPDPSGPPDPEVTRLADRRARLSSAS